MSFLVALLDAFHDTLIHDTLIHDTPIDASFLKYSSWCVYSSCAFLSWCVLFFMFPIGKRFLDVSSMLSRYGDLGTETATAFALCVTRLGNRER